MAGRDIRDRVRKALGDRYDVITAVGRGGTASIFGAYDKSGQRVAIKVLHPELTVSVAADRFLRETRYAGRLHHPHIAPLLDSGETDYLLWFVMPFVPGETLRQVLRREQRLPVERACRAACEVLEALGYAHGEGLAHRDIKPDNIVLSDGGAVLVDFGIARAIATSGEDRVTRSGFVVGTEEYMSPEQAAGSPTSTRGRICTRWGWCCSRRWAVARRSRRPAQPRSWTCTSTTQRRTCGRCAARCPSRSRWRWARRWRSRSPSAGRAPRSCARRCSPTRGG